MTETELKSVYRIAAENEVSLIITAFKEGWSEQRWDHYVTRLENIFRSFEDRGKLQ